MNSLACRRLYTHCTYQYRYVFFFLLLSQRNHSSRMSNLLCTRDWGWCERDYYCTVSYENFDIQKKVKQKLEFNLVKKMNLHKICMIYTEQTHFQREKTIKFLIQLITFLNFDTSKRPLFLLKQYYNKKTNQIF